MSGVSRERTMVVPVMYIDSLRISLPYFESVQAGFPSPADDYFEEEIRLEDQLVRNPEATIFLRVRGHSMNKAGIFQDSVLVVDRSLQPRNGDTVVVALDGEFTVKWYYKQGVSGEEIHLLPGNTAFSPIVIREGSHWMFVIWGVVTHVIHKPLRP